MRHETQKAQAYYGLEAIVFWGMDDGRSFLRGIVLAEELECKRTIVFRGMDDGRSFLWFKV
ncbi:MAG: hypothetical protein ACO3NK_17730 [Prochlorotrichaceae cyanobacterium]